MGRRNDRLAVGSASGGKPAEERHLFDQANRLVGNGVRYDQLGNTTSLPAEAAGGQTLSSTFYADNQLATQTQGATTMSYVYDPAGRTLQASKHEGSSQVTTIMHYAGPGSQAAWEGTSESSYTRHVEAFGELAAVHQAGKTAQLELHDLRGDIVGQVADTEGGYTPEELYVSTEFGVPTTASPPKHGFLGGLGLKTELPSGVMTMGARSYVPQLGRFLQDDPVEGGSANAFAYTYGDPVNSVDPSGAFVAVESYVTEFAGQHAIEVVEREAAREAALAARRVIDADGKTTYPPASEQEVPRQAQASLFQAA
jgi:RHS repeat-associated protein